MTDLQKYKEISIKDFCLNNQIKLDKEHGHYVKLLEHDSLVINLNTNIFIWNSRQLSGDIIDFIQAYYSVNFKEAISILKREVQLPTRIKTITNKPAPDIKEHIFNLSSIKEDFEFKNAYAYLFNTRKLAAKTINFFYQNNYIRQDTHKNIIFYVLNNEKKKVGAILKGTNTYKPYNCIVPGTPNSGVIVDFSNDPKKIYFLESMIDLMSFYEIYPQKAINSIFVALHGLKINCLKDCLRNYKSAIPILAVDSDTAGDIFYNKILKDEELKEYKFEREFPKHKDWNDDLKALKQDSLVLHR